MNDHTLIKDTHTLTHWHGNTACGADEEPDRIVLKMKGGFPEFTFEKGKIRHLEHLEYALANAFERGKAERSAEIVKLLGLQRLINNG